jgi:hypothetical protein
MKQKPHLHQSHHCHNSANITTAKTPQQQHISMDTTTAAPMTAAASTPQMQHKSHSSSANVTAAVSTPQSQNHTCTSTAGATASPHSKSVFRHVMKQTVVMAGC